MSANIIARFYIFGFYLYEPIVLPHTQRLIYIYIYIYERERGSIIQVRHGVPSQKKS